MALRPSSVPLRFPLMSPPASSLPDDSDPESDLSTASSALVAEIVDFAAACRLDHAASLVAESKFDCPPSIGGECALGTDVLEDRQEDFECLAAITGPYSSQWQTAMDVEMASRKSTGINVDAVPPPRANIVDDMWIFRVKRPPGSPPIFKARYVAQGFSQRQGVDFFQILLPYPEDHSSGTQWSLRWPVYGLRQAPRKWHDALRIKLAALGFDPSTAGPSLFLRTDTSLPPFYILVYVNDLVFASAYTEALALVLQRFSFRFSAPQSTPLPTGHSLSAPLSDESVKPSGPYPELEGCLITLGMGLVLGGRGPVVLTGHADASWVADLAMQRSSEGYTFSLGSGCVSWPSTRSSL
ncbi:unnamed protein product [Closterium sp. NIES-53]